MHHLLPIVLGAILAVSALTALIRAARRSDHQRMLGRDGRRAIRQARRADRRAFRDPRFWDPPQDRRGR